VIASWLLRIPVVIHEQNALPGATNRLASRFARKVAISFPITASSFRGDVTVTGNPVREEFFAAPPLRPRILVRLLAFGGSQGARILNQRLIEALPLLTGTSIGIVHQTGERDHAVVSDVYARSAFRGAVVVPFLDDMPRELGASDLVLARAGATTVAELAAAGRGAILVPFAAAAGGHQEANAEALAAIGAAIVIRESELTATHLADTIRELVQDPKRLVAMGERARTLARPDAARSLAALVMSLVNGGG
jgi:UDP-N-acetylglucosamine--N-acetylmuramyl-(pentapeptide) pyrophosphoryl-undecaprenol N-acetylglucosamine transferase